MSPNRWLILGSHIPATGGLGGMIRYTVEVTRSLEKRDDVEVHIHCRPETVEFLRTDLGVSMDRLHPTASGSTVRDSAAEVLSLGRLGAKLRADVIFGSKQLLPRLGGGAVRLLTVHDMLPFDRPNDFGPTKRLLLPPAYGRSIKAADVLACVSNAARDRLVAHFPDVVSRAVVVPNALTSSLTAARPEPIAALAGRRFALMVGDRSLRKNAGFIIGLWAEVEARVPGAHLALAGPPGWGRNEEIAGLSALMDRGAISELGYVSDGALRWAYETAHVTLCPSLLEGFGLPVVEALALGCPTIISCDPAQIEAANGTATAVDLARRDDWIAAIDDHLQRRKPVPPGGDRRSWDQMADELVASVAAIGRRDHRIADGRGVG